VQAGLAHQPASWRGTLATTPPSKTGAAPGVYRRHRPEATALYEVVRDNIETLFGAINTVATFTYLRRLTYRAGALRPREPPKLR